MDTARIEIVSMSIVVRVRVASELLLMNDKRAPGLTSSPHIVWLNEGLGANNQMSNSDTFQAIKRVYIYILISAHKSPKSHLPHSKNACRQQEEKLPDETSQIRWKRKSSPIIKIMPCTDLRATKETETKIVNQLAVLTHRANADDSGRGRILGGSRVPLNNYRH
ncbi:hypothetical protein L3Y34_008754 [Caenorhabditis briggsae]|uniref:Uncharacterized protein n=1 Tax=Caenorhabditis briggsae TaxID=6238 RepID=A0AAE9A294_CAEBR|nr:hypothetical protein L3Y34_008754 [Caenorhabditis briggsae]